MNLERIRPPSPYEYLPRLPSFTVTSQDVEDGQPLATTFVHDSAGGQNQSPQLAWSGFPTQTQSFAITCFDPDAPTGSGWWHWLLVNLPASTTSLPRGAGSGAGLPADVVMYRTDFGVSGYQGAAPPPGDHAHRYLFVIHALNVPSLSLAPDTPAAIVGFHLTAHGIARATVAATFQH